MKINKLTASFGKLENASLELNDGLNVISAPNESGKSTWCAFIRAMFYGIDTSERAKGSFIPDKQKYAPWSGAPMQGSMDITVGGKDITLSRATSGKTGLMKDFSAVYTGTSVPVDGLNGTNAGEKLLGISKDVFNRSVFVEQGAVAVSGSPELEKRIAAIVSTGEETGSYSEADSRLRAWQRKRRFNRIGMIPELGAKLADAEARMAEISAVSREAAESDGKLASAKARCAELEDALKEAKAYARERAYMTLTGACSDLERQLAEKQALCAGLENELEADRAARRTSAINQLKDTCAGLESEYADKKAACVRLEQDVFDMRKRQRRDALERLNASRAELNACAAERDAAASALISAREALSASPYSGEGRDTVVEKLNSAADEADRLAAVAEGKRVVSVIPTIIVFILFAAAAVCAVLLNPMIAISAAILLFLSIFLLYKYVQSKKTLNAALDKRASILASLHADDPDGLRVAAGKYAALCDAAANAEKRDAAARAAFEQKQTRQAFLEQAALNELDFNGGDSEGARLSHELSAKKDELQALADSIATLRGRIAAFGESGAPAVPDSEQLSAALAGARADAAMLAEKAANLRGRIASVDLSAALSAEPDAESADPEAARLSRVLIAAREDLRRLTAHGASLLGKMSAMGDPLVLSSEEEYMRDEISQLENEYAALELAISVLRESDAEIQSRFSPALGKAAAEYMSAITDGRYDEVLVNRDFSVITHLSGDTLRRESAYLSAGTLDLMYLCVRLAVCDLALPGGEPCPLIIDDALANLDEKRFSKVIKALEAIAETRQVILFTCREK